jgi:hypothetical protein
MQGREVFVALQSQSSLFVRNYEARQEKCGSRLTTGG